MRKGKLLILAIMVVAIASMLTAGEVMAFCDYCDESPAETMTLFNDQGKGFTIELVGITPNGARFDWEYFIHNEDSANKVTGVNFAAILIPDCCTDPKVDIDLTLSDPPAPTMQSFAVAEGEQTKYFGRGITQGWVVKSPPDKTKLVLSLNTDIKMTTTIYLETAGGSLYYEMVGPGCTPPPPPDEPVLGSRSYSQCLNFGLDTKEPFEIEDNGVIKTFPATADDVSIFVIRNDDRNGCFAAAWRCIGLDCSGCTAKEGCPSSTACESVDLLPWSDKIITQTSFSPVCPDENASVTQGSPFYLYTTNSGGLTGESCLDLGQYKWVSVVPNCHN